MTSALCQANFWFDAIIAGFTERGDRALPSVSYCEAMHKKTYQLRQIIGAGPVRLPGRVHPRFFGSAENAQRTGSDLYGEYSITPVCFCELYRKDLKRRWSQRPFEWRRANKRRRIAQRTWFRRLFGCLYGHDLGRFLRTLYGAGYRYLEAYLTGSRGYRVYWREIRRMFFPKHEDWPHQ